MTMLVATIERPLTYKELEEFPDDGKRREVIGGTLYVSPAPTRPHQKVLGRFFAHFRDEIELTGGDVLNGDGMELRFRTLYVVQNEQNKVGIVRLSLDLRSGDYTGAITDPDLDVPTTATVNSGFLWAVNARFGTPPTPRTDYDVVRLPLRVG